METPRRRTLVSLILDLFTPVEFEFHTTRTPDECRLLLEKAFNHGNWMLNNVHKAEVRVLSETTQRFQIYKQLGRGMAVEAAGQLEVLDGATTRVEGSANIHRNTYLSLLGIALIVAFYLIVAPNFGYEALKVAFAGLFLLAILLVLAISLWRQDKLIDQIEALLTRG